MGEFALELWAFMRERKKFWLLPIVVGPGAVRRTHRADPGVGHRTVHLHALLSRLSGERAGVPRPRGDRGIRRACPTRLASDHECPSARTPRFRRAIWTLEPHGYRVALDQSDVGAGSTPRIVGRERAEKLVIRAPLREPAYIGGRTDAEERAVERDCGLDVHKATLAECASGSAPARMRPIRSPARQPVPRFERYKQWSAPGTGSGLNASPEGAPRHPDIFRGMPVLVVGPWEGWPR